MAEPDFNAWSMATNGVCARVRVEFEDLRPGLRHAVYLQLRNASLDPVAFYSQPHVRAVLADAQGQPLAASSLPTSGPAPVPQWAVVPRDAYVALRIDTQTFGMPTRARGTILLAAGDSAWELRPGRYVLNVTTVFSPRVDGPPNQWTGHVMAPAVEVVVTREMLAASDSTGT
jgi:hypothetical protein